MEEKNHTKISIPDSLAEKIKKMMKETDFPNLSSYVTYMLKQNLLNIDKEEFNENDEKKIKERLKSLGYLE